MSVSRRLSIRFITDQVGDLSPKCRDAEGNDKKDSKKIIKNKSDLPSTSADAPLRLKLAYLSRRSPTCLDQQVRNMS
ncbi:MAG: hypothetical protein LBB88_10395, partial [Planctomycetaceae bacterium]|nr:hypothetical protein [Planctomycetaceae bacterium]